jgi:hypothetical protein
LLPLLLFVTLRTLAGDQRTPATTHDQHDSGPR